MRAFYFSETSKKLRHGDNRQIRRGRTHKVKCEPVLCKSGLHASERLVDALKYAPGPYLWLVELGGEIVQGDDKVVGTERTYVDGFDVTDLLREFGRKQALINIERLYNYCPKKDYDLIVEYLKTGDEDIRSTAESAAWSTARSAAGTAAWDAAGAARSAAYAAARSAARSAWAAAEPAANDMLMKMVKDKTGWDIWGKK